MAEGAEGAGSTETRRIENVTGGVLVVVGGAVLIGGWWGGIEGLQGLGTRGASTKAETAVGLLLLGLALLARPGNRWGRTAGGTVGAVGAAALAGHLFDGAVALGAWVPFVDGAPAKEALTSVPTALCLVALGAAAALPVRGPAGWARVALAGAGTTLAAATLLAYVYRWTAEGVLTAATGMAAPTAAALCVAGAGLLGPGPALGLAQSSGIGGRLVRRVTLPAVLLVSVVGFGVNAGQRIGWYDQVEYSHGLLVAFATLVLVVGLLAVGHRLDQVAASAEERDALLSALTKQNEQMAVQSARLAQSNRDLRGFAGMAAHDLRQPAQTLSRFVELAEEAAGPDAGADLLEYLGYARSSAERLQTLLDDILAWSGAASSELRSGEVDLRKLAEESTRHVGPRSGEPAADVAVVGEARLWGDESRLFQLLTNLVGNALTYVDEGVRPEVRVILEQRGGGARITVEDNGIGVDPRFRDRIFEPFRRLHGQGDYPGTGMGLAIARRVAERHGGGIDVAPRPEGGSRFVVDLGGAPPGNGATPGSG